MKLGDFTPGGREFSGLSGGAVMTQLLSVLEGRLDISFTDPERDLLILGGFFLASLLFPKAQPTQKAGHQPIATSDATPDEPPSRP